MRGSLSPVGLILVVLGAALAASIVLETEARHRSALSVGTTPQPASIVRASGFRIELLPAVSPPSVTRDEAIRTASREFDRVLSPPTAEYWLATNPVETTTNTRDPMYMVRRPVWVVHFDKAVMEGNAGSMRNPKPLQDIIYEVRATAFVDARTGEFLWLGAQSIGPTPTPDASATPGAAAPADNDYST